MFAGIPVSRYNVVEEREADMVFNPDSREWEGEIVVRSCVVNVSMTGAWERESAEKTADAVRDAITADWDEIRDRLAAKLLALYNDAWLPAGKSALDRDSFLREIDLTHASVDAPTGAFPALKLYFKDNGLFGGKTIHMHRASDGLLGDPKVAG